MGMFQLRFVKRNKRQIIKKIIQQIKIFILISQEILCKEILILTEINKIIIEITNNNKLNNKFFILPIAKSF
jgi:hypothetical protein